MFGWTFDRKVWWGWHYWKDWRIENQKIPANVTTNFTKFFGLALGPIGFFWEKDSYDDE